MANPNRRLATIRTIDSITPIEGADRIECAHLGGWSVVCDKGEFAQGEPVIYFEVDSFLPKSDERFAFLMPRGTKTMLVDGREVEGHVLRTAKLRGQYSQGLIMPIDAFPEVVNALALTRSGLGSLAKEHFDVTGAVGIWEYERPLPPGNTTIIAGFDSDVAPRTDAERAQNVSQRVFDLIKACDYLASVKVDGTSITMACADDGHIRIFSHNYEISCDEGMGATVCDIARETGLAEIVRNHPRLAFQMELCGPAIQSDRLRLAKHTLFVFSVWDRDRLAYLSPYDVLGDAAERLACPRADIDLDDFATPSDLLAHVDGMRGNVTRDVLDEGIVIHVMGPGAHPAADWPLVKAEIEGELGPQLQMKAISNRYLLKQK